MAEKILKIPNLSLVLLIGPSGCGKSTFARRHFLPTEVLSSDETRAWVSDDETDQSASSDAFDVLRYIAGKRLARGRLTVIDATNVQPDARAPFIELAQEHHVLPVAIVFKLPEKVCRERNRNRPNRDFGAHVIENQARQLRRSLRNLSREGFRRVHILETEEEVESVRIVREPLWTDRRDDTGPFDIVGDIHGCFDELLDLLGLLGYAVEEREGPPRTYAVTPPSGRKAVFLGDLVDRGPRIPDVLRLVISMVEARTALCVPGNHDVKLVRKLDGRDVRIAHGLAESLEQLEREPPEFRKAVRDFLDGLVSHYVLDGGRLVVAHGGMREEMQGRASARVRDFALYGETTGETDEFGLPVRYNWAQDYRGEAIVVYGHTPVPEPTWLNRTINIDTGCVFGGKLTALRYPEKELVSVPARRMYSVPAKPIGTGTVPGEPQRGDVLDIQDVLGKRVVETRLRGRVTIREENAAAALEAMSRFAVDPKWLIYLPPTMSPSETSRRDGFLEHPAEAFDHYRREGVERVVCEEKHMGSRAVVVLCRDEETARRRFRVVEPARGIVYTRTGRRFFDDPETEEFVLARLAAAAERAGLWEELATDWMCLDTELMPWSAKAQELLREQYASVGAAGRASLPEAVAALSSSPAADNLVRKYAARLEHIQQFTEAYRRYCWTVTSPEDLRLAPFHILAGEGAVYTDKDHLWHLERIGRLIEADGGEGLLLATPYRVVEPGDPAAVEDAVVWWEELTGRGGEGMVVKPLPFVAQGRRGLVQPAVKCRGREYLRIIYGPDYTEPEHMERLRDRHLASKRSLALREFALGIEALERFVQGEPLYRVHECVFAVLALESEPVDPRL